MSSIYRHAAFAALSALSLSAVAAEPATGTAPQATHAAGMRAYVDPETGTLVDHPVTAAQKAFAAAATDASFDQRSDGLREVVHPSGAVVTDLQGRFEQAMVATRDADGNLGVACGDPAHASLGAHSHEAAGHAVPAKREER